MKTRIISKFEEDRLAFAGGNSSTSAFSPTMFEDAVNDVLLSLVHGSYPLFLISNPNFALKGEDMV